MQSWSQADVITQLKTGTYPTTQKGLSYYEQKQKFPIYPFVEVRKVQSNSATTDIQKVAEEQVFEIRFYMKYTAPESVEEADRIATENELLARITAKDWIPTGIIQLESKTWTTQIIEDPIYGSKSTLRFSIKDVDTTSGSGLIGADDKLELNSGISGTFTIQILSLNTTQGFDMDAHFNDKREKIYDPNQLVKFGEFTITYENTNAIQTAIKAINDLGVTNNGKYIRGNSSDGTLQTKQFSFLIGSTSTIGSYGDIERATTTFYATGTW
tara:strand:- start:848 stop:1657 length:810 start_codon:yes stop_codon:yes gene_type:complete